VQEFSGKTGTQQTFFHIFNHLRLNGKQIILTADRPPVEIDGLEDRLLTRFKWGLQAELEKPDKELRKRILLDKVRKDGLNISENVIDYISENINNSIRDLEGVINSLLAYSVVYNNCDIDMQLVNKVMSRFITVNDAPITTDTIIEKVCDFFNVTSESVYSKSRKQPIVYIRQMAIYLSNKYTDKSTTEIGRLFGGRNHATVIHSINQIKNLIETEEKTSKDLEQIECMLVNG